MEIRKRNKLVFYSRIGWLYTKYQILTKSLLFFIIFPIFKIVSNYLIYSTGRVSVSSGDYVEFLFSLQGVGLLISSLIIVTILIGIDINAFIIMSALIQENRIKLTARHLLVVGLRSLESFLNPSGIFVMLYVVIVIPLVGVGLSVSITQNLKIPNFITDVIFRNNMYLTLYLGVLLVLTIITVVHVFFFHYLIIEKQPIGLALKNSSKLMKKHWKECFKAFFMKIGLVSMLVIAGAMFISFLLFAFIQSFSDILTKRIWSIFVTMIITEIIAYMAMMVTPFICSILTTLFYKFNKEDGKEIKLKMEVKAGSGTDTILNKITMRTKLSVSIFIFIVLSFNLMIASFSGIYFDDIFKTDRKIDIVAHRGGGNLAAENTILGLERAIAEGVQWSEIDVQRTKDDQYIIHHDTTFTRLTGVGKVSAELTLDEIKQLKVKDLFNNDGVEQHVATLEEFLDAAKGRIGLFIELKGSTADTKMADDVIKMVKEKKMESGVAILSLNYKLITYIEQQYPNIETGFLYFFSIGDTHSMKGDILIMEEQEATPEKVDEIHKAGKKAIVWTVNSDESMKTFVNSNVDGIITDYVRKLKQGIKERDNREDMEIIIDSILQ